MSEPAPNPGTGEASPSVARILIVGPATERRDAIGRRLAEALGSTILRASSIDAAAARLRRDGADLAIVDAADAPDLLAAGPGAAPVIVIGRCEAVLPDWRVLECDDPHACRAVMPALVDAELARVRAEHASPARSAPGDALDRALDALGAEVETSARTHEAAHEADARARAAERRLAQALSVVADGYALFDAEDRLVMCNDTYRYRLNPLIADVIRVGASYETILRAACDRGLVALDGDAREEWIRWRLRAHRSPGDPIELERGDGQWHLMREHRSADGFTVLVISDITERKRRELDLVASERRFRDFAEITADWFWETDAELRYTWLSDRYHEATGYVREDVIGRTARERYEALSYTPEEFEAHVGALEARRAFTGIETRTQRADGSLLVRRTSGKPVLDDAGVFLGFRGTAIDVTDHYLARIELERQKNLLETIVDSIPDALAIVDTERTMQLVNPALLRMFGYTADQLVGRSTRILYADDEEHARFGRQHFNLDMPESHVPLVGRFRRSNGEEFPAEAVGALVRDLDGRVTGWLGLMRDVTERERAERERAALETQLRQSRKLQAIGQLTGGIAHDFNNILASVLGYASLALERQIDDPRSKLAEYLREVQRAGERGRALVAQLLTFSRGGTARAQRIDLAPAVEEAVRLLRPTLPATIGVEVRADPAAPGVMLDPVQAQQLVLNLCINARDAMPDGGAIRIAIEPTRMRGTRCTACQEPIEGDYVELRVEDSGEGISRALMERIFDPFFSTKDVGVGSGMGLSVVHGILHRNAGHVVVDSAGAGTRFRLLLPALDGPAGGGSEPAHPPHEGLAAPEPGTRVLVVDDEAPIAGYVADLIQAYGYLADVYTDPRAALDRLEGEPGRYAVLVADQTMPGIAGAELVRRARRACPGLPVVLCTGYSDAVDSRAVAAWGRSRYLAKPVAPRDLLVALRELLRAGSG